MQSSAFKGVFLLLEGDSDSRLYRKFIDTNGCSPVPAHGRDNVLGAMTILLAEQKPGIVAIIDRDFDTISKVDMENEHLIATDSHDLETMLLQSRALESLLLEKASDAKLTAYMKDYGDVRQKLLSLATPVGCLRYISITEGLCLKFEGLKFSEFIDKNDLSLDMSRLIKSVKNNSGKHGLDEKALSEKVATLLAGGHDDWMIVCGHDMICALSVCLQKAWGNQNYSSADLESTLRCAYEEVFFKLTRVYSRIEDWQERNNSYKVLRQAI